MNHRILTDSEPVAAGDEFRLPLLREWQPIYPEMVGKTRPQINAETPGIPCRYAEFRRDREQELKQLRTLVKQLTDVVSHAKEHLEYTGYGDSWEREGARAAGLPEELELALIKGRAIG